jgi:hypothetical protein
VFRTFTRNWKVALVITAIAGMFLASFASSPTASAHAAIEQKAQNVCSASMIPYYDGHIYDNWHPWLHHYFAKLVYTSPNRAGGWIEYQSEFGGVVTFTPTAWGTTNVFGLSEWFITDHYEHWSEGWRYRYYYYC